VAFTFLPADQGRYPKGVKVAPEKLEKTSAVIISDFALG